MALKCDKGGGKVEHHAGISGSKDFTNLGTARESAVC